MCLLLCNFLIWLCPPTGFSAAPMSQSLKTECFWPAVDCVQNVITFNMSAAFVSGRRD